MMKGEMVNDNKGPNRRIPVFTGITLLGIVFALGLFAAGCKKAADTSSPGGVGTQTAARYHCPMHPNVVSDKPGSCPICKMDLVPIEPQEAPASDEHKDHQHTQAPAPSAMEGQAAVRISRGREQMIGVRTSLVEKRPLVHKIQASAKVAYDAELYSAIIEYREALKGENDIKDSPWSDVKDRSRSLVASSKLRLQVMGLSDGQIQRLAESSDDPTQLLLSEPGRNVWIYAQIYEQEASMVKRGQLMEVTSSALPGQTYTGRVISVDRMLNPETRSLRVRAEVPNPQGLLKPEMYLDAVIIANLGEALAVPNEAILHTGTRQLVFVQTGEGQYDPREVRTGHEASGFVEIVEGLKAGERVVTSANFLIDSESKLKSALSGSSAGHQH